MDTAAEAVKTIVSRVPNLPDEGGVRISDTGAETGLELSLAPAPEATDTVVDSNGAHVFLDAGAAASLEDRVLDAELNEDGSVRFALGAQG